MTTNLRQSQRHYALPTLLIFVVILLGGLYYVKPMWDEVDVLKTATLTQQKEKDSLQKQLVDLKDLQQSLDAGSEVSRQTTLDSIPERFEQDRLISDLTGLADKSGVILNGVNFSVPTTSEDKIKRATINVNVSGNDDTLVEFLRAVENNSRKLVVKSITVQSGKTETGTARVNFNLNMETYYQDRI